MKLKDVLGKLNKNKSNGQLTTCIRKTNLKKAGMSETELLNMNINTKLKTLLFEN